jgi:hypothetical protein
VDEDDDDGFSGRGDGLQGNEEDTTGPERSTVPAASPT